MTFQIKIIIFIVVSVAIFCISRSSLTNIRSHGFYRFFTFETILVLVLLNIDYWFDDPFCIRQITAWLLLSVSLLLVIHGAWLLNKVGKPDKGRKDPSLLGIEKTTELITVGAYRYIRHPLYSSLLFGTWGVFFKNPSWSGIALAVITSCFLTLTARAEEIENIQYFGPAYKDYMNRTKMFIPYIF